MPSDPDFEFSSLPSNPEGWIYVRGGGLAQPVDVKIRIEGTAVVVTAVRVDNEEQVGTADLRSIRIGELGAQLWRHIQEELARADDAVGGDPIEMPKSSWDAYQATLAGAWDIPDIGAWELVEMAAARDQLRQWIQDLRVPEGFEVGARGRGATPPSDDEYRGFAKAYLEELNDRAHGAKSRTGRRLGMDRSTVYRWIAECQRRGYLPNGESR